MKNEERESHAQKEYTGSAAAGDLPRGLGVIVAPKNAIGAAMGRLLYRQLLLHIALGEGDRVNLAEIIPRKTAGIYYEKDDLEQDKIRLKKMTERMMNYENNSVDLLLKNYTPLRRSSIDKKDHEEFQKDIASYSYVGLPNIQRLAEFEAKTWSDKIFILQYLARVSDLTETTIATVVGVEDIEIATYGAGDVWNVPFFSLTRWSAHVIANDEEDINIHIVWDGKSRARYQMEYTGKGFRRAN